MGRSFGLHGCVGGSLLAKNMRVCRGFKLVIGSSFSLRALDNVLLPLLSWTSRDGTTAGELC